MEKWELEHGKERLRIQCDLAYLITNDKWFAEQRDRIPEKEIKIISKEEVTKKFRELNSWEKKLSTKK